MTLVGSEVEVDHVAGLAGRLGAGLHRHPDVGLSQRRRIVGAVAAHGDEPALGLLLADQPQLVLGGRLGEEVVDAGFRGDRRGGDRVVAGDHHRADAHAAQVGEALLHAGLDHVLQVDDAHQGAVLRHRQRRAARAGDAVDRGAHLRRHGRGRNTERLQDRVDRALAPALASGVEAGEAGRGAERHRRRILRRHAGQALLQRQLDDRAAFGGLVGQRGHHGRAERRFGPHARRRDHLGRHAVAVGDGAGLVEQQRVAVAGGFDRAARGGQHVELQEPVHAGDADRREQAGDRGRDQADEERAQHQRVELHARVLAKAQQRRHRRSGR